MRKLLSLALLSGALLFSAASPVWAQNASPRQFVIVVAEGVNPQTADFGSIYVRTAYEAGTDVAIDNARKASAPVPVGADIIASMRGVLKTAEGNGYKTGVVTTGNALQVAPMFYDVAPADNAALLGSGFDFVAGGGRSSVSPDAAQAMTGVSVLSDAAALEGEEIGPRVLALQGDEALSYALDRNLDKDAGFGELVTLALSKLGGDEGTDPFVLIVHDTLMQRALVARDTPAVLNQFRELDGIVAEVSGLREANPQLALALVLTGGDSAPQFNTELPNERSDALYMLSQLPMSYEGAGRALTGANEAKLAAFADPKEGQYKGFAPSAENRTALLNGTLTGEAAIRAAYEPALKISFEPVRAQGVAYAVGFDAGNDVVGAVKATVSSAPPAAVAMPEMVEPAAM